MPAAAEPAYDAMLEELEELLCGIAAGRALNRAAATSYSSCRLRLIASPLRPVLPGFVHQCVSLLRFKDFITLYDPAIGERQRFVRDRLGPCWSNLGAPAPREEPARPGGSQSHHWML